MSGLDPPTVTLDLTTIRPGPTSLCTGTGIWSAGTVLCPTLPLPSSCRKVRPEPPARCWSWAPRALVPRSPSQSLGPAWCCVNLSGVRDPFGMLESKGFHSFALGFRVQGTCAAPGGLQAVASMYRGGAGGSLIWGGRKSPQRSQRVAWCGHLQHWACVTVHVFLKLLGITFLFSVCVCIKFISKPKTYGNHWLFKSHTFKLACTTS